MTHRRKTRTVMVGDVAIGGGHPVSIQSMTKTHTGDVDATVEQGRRLAEAGCQILRVAVPTVAAAQAIAEIKPKVPVPIVADVHFRPEIAIAALEAGADKIRLNPGNTRRRDKVKPVLELASRLGRPIRLGVNSGSVRPRQGSSEEARLEPTKQDDEQEMASLMVRVLLDWCDFCESVGLKDIVLSAKASDAATTMDAYRKLADACDYPLHLGITAAGLPADGRMKSGVVIGGLLAEGIGDTIRVSLTGDPVEEVEAAQEILAILGMRERRGVEIISCPTCGRCEVDSVAVAEAVKQRTRHITVPLRVAVMGCVVNGPGEASEADIGIAAGRDSWTLFCKGRKVRKIPHEHVVEEFLAEIHAMSDKVAK